MNFLRSISTQPDCFLSLHIWIFAFFCSEFCFHTAFESFFTFSISHTLEKAVQQNEKLRFLGLAGGYVQQGVFLVTLSGCSRIWWDHICLCSFFFFFLSKESQNLLTPQNELSKFNTRPQIKDCWLIGHGGEHKMHHRVYLCLQIQWILSLRMSEFIPSAGSISGCASDWRCFTALPLMHLDLDAGDFPGCQMEPNA